MGSLLRHRNNSCVPQTLLKHSEDSRPLLCGLSDHRDALVFSTTGFLRRNFLSSKHIARSMPQAGSDLCSPKLWPAEKAPWRGVSGDGLGVRGAEKMVTVNGSRSQGGGGSSDTGLFGLRQRAPHFSPERLCHSWFQAHENHLKKPENRSRSQVQPKKETQMRGPTFWMVTRRHPGDSRERGNRLNYACGSCHQKGGSEPTSSLAVN